MSRPTKNASAIGQSLPTIVISLDLTAPDSSYRLLPHPLTDLLHHIVPNLNKRFLITQPSRSIPSNAASVAPIYHRSKFPDQERNNLWEHSKWVVGVITITVVCWTGHIPTSSALLSETTYASTIWPWMINLRIPSIVATVFQHGGKIFQQSDFHPLPLAVP